MGSSSGSSSGTQRTEPPTYQLPYLQQGIQYSQGLFNEGGPQQYQGNTVVPFAPQTEQALAGIEQRALSGSPVTQAAQDYATKSLNGGFLGQGNPYLDQTFKRAADQSYNTLTSQFARSGRNVNAAAPVQGEMLNDLASRIYGGAYESERDRQQSVLPYASPLAEQDYRDLSALRGVGSEVENLTGRIIDDQSSRWDYEQQRPEAALDSYLNRISGNLGSTTTINTPQYRNRMAGAAGGALTGYQVGGPYGALIGGVAGGLFA